MGFFQTLKNKLGIGGVSVKCGNPGQVAKNSGELKGKIILSSKSEQEVVSLRYVFWKNLPRAVATRKNERV